MMTKMTPSVSGLPPLTISPCTNCGSTGWTEVDLGVYERGCCTENGSQRPVFVVAAEYVKSGE